MKDPSKINGQDPGSKKTPFIIFYAVVNVKSKGGMVEGHMWLVSLF